MKIGMLGVASVLMSYWISNTKIQNGSHLAKILGENAKYGNIGIVGSKIYEMRIK